MNPPSAKPFPGAIEDPETPESATSDAAAAETGTPQTDITQDTETDYAADATPASGRSGGPRRRAAALELRVAGNEDGETRASRAARLATRTGPRAQQRAARAARADGQPDEVDQSDEDQGDLRDDGLQVATPVATATPIVATQPSLAVATAQPAVQVRAPAPNPTQPGDPVQGEILPDEDDESGDDRTGGGRRRMGPRAEKRAAKAAKNNDAAHYIVAPAVSAAQMRPRHYGVVALFVLMVLIPTASYGLYLWTKAADQYESNVGFGSRTEDAPSTFDFLGALGGVSQSGSKDMDILDQFIISQELVAKLDKQLDLKTIYGKATDDPLNRFSPGGTIEDLVAYWQRMVVVNYDNGTGLMTLDVFAFEPSDSKKIAESILVESTKIINDLSLTAQEDTTRYSKDALTAAEKKLSDARLAVLDYQVRNHIVDPTTVIATQNGVIGTLNQQLANSQIELDMLTGTVGVNDVRISTLNRRIEVIQNRINEEEAKVGASDAGTPGYAKLMQEFERLKVDQDFAERAYLSSLAAYDQAINDAQHKTRYLATYVAPTLAEAPTAPNRPLTLLVVALSGFLLWSVLVLIYYALRDRR